MGTHCICGLELNIKAKVPPWLRMPHQTEKMILKSDIPNSTEVQVANETLEGIDNAIGLDARNRLLEDERTAAE